MIIENAVKISRGFGLFCSSITDRRKKYRGKCPRCRGNVYTLYGLKVCENHHYLGGKLQFPVYFSNHRNFVKYEKKMAERMFGASEPTKKELLEIEKS